MVTQRGEKAITVLLFIIAAIHLNTAIEIFQSPNHVTVFQDMSPAVFECEVNGEFAGWRINSTPFNSLPLEIRNDLTTLQVTSDEGNELLTLIIPARVEYNGTTVQCITGIIGGGAVLESDNATMSVQGILSSVTDLGTYDNDTSVTVSWTAPFSLDVTGVDPDIWYSVIIYNVTHEPTVIPCTDCVNITETHYTFTPHYPSPCQEYVFTVIPLNGAGQGETSHNVTGYTIDDQDKNIQVADPAIRVINSSYFQVVLEISGAVCEYYLSAVDQSTIIDTQLLDDEDGLVITYTLTAIPIYTLKIWNSASNISLKIDISSSVATMRCVVATISTTEEPSQTISTSTLPCTGSSHHSTLFGEGVGVGLAVGVMTSSVVVVVTIIILKCRHRRDQKKVTLKRNVAYEVHSPGTLNPRRPQTGTPLYEECT